MVIQIIAGIVVAGIVVYYLKKEKEKSDEYFGGPKKYNKKELAILESYKRIYKPVPNNKSIPNLKRDGYDLEDILFTATQMVYQNPLPTGDEKAKLNKGDLVKLVFKDKEGDVERMWVEIAERNDQFFKGVLRNDAFETDGLKEGKFVHFHSNHIYQIDRKASS